MVKLGKNMHTQCLFFDLSTVTREKSSSDCVRQPNRLGRPPSIDKVQIPLMPSPNEIICDLNHLIFNVRASRFLRIMFFIQPMCAVLFCIRHILLITSIDYLAITIWNRFADA